MTPADQSRRATLAALRRASHREEMRFRADGRPAVTERVAGVRAERLAHATRQLDAEAEKGLAATPEQERPALERRIARVRRQIADRENAAPVLIARTPRKVAPKGQVTRHDIRAKYEARRAAKLPGRPVLPSLLERLMVRAGLPVPAPVPSPAMDAVEAQRAAA